jgi:hypothetical protein
MLTVWIDNGDCSEKKRLTMKAEADYVFSSLEAFVDNLSAVFSDKIS